MPDNDPITYHCQPCPNCDATGLVGPWFKGAELSECRSCKGTGTAITYKQRVAVSVEIVEHSRESVQETREALEDREIFNPGNSSRAALGIGTRIVARGNTYQAYSEAFKKIEEASSGWPNHLSDTARARIISALLEYGERMRDS